MSLNILTLLEYNTDYPTVLIIVRVFSDNALISRWQSQRKLLLHLMVSLLIMPTVAMRISGLCRKNAEVATLSIMYSRRKLNPKTVKNGTNNTLEQQIEHKQYCTATFGLNLFSRFRRKTIAKVTPEVPDARMPPKSIKL